MAVNDNWHVHAGRDCCTGCSPGGGQPSLSPYSSWPLPMAFPPPPPRCPATVRHTQRYTVELVGLQCHYEPDHDGDHAAYTGPGEGDIFWPQETGVPVPYEGGGGGSYSPPPGATVTVT
jgi:hypothetical protein